MGQKIGNWIKNGAKRLTTKLLTSPISWAVIGGIIFFLLIILLIIGFAGSRGVGEINSSSSANGYTTDDQWEQLRRFIGYMEGGTTVYQNASGQDCYMVMGDGGASYAVAGVDMIAHGSYFSSLGYGTSVGSLIPVDVVISFRDEELQGNYDYAERKFSEAGINLTQYQLFAFASRAFNCGDWGSFNYCDEDPISAYKNYWNQSRDDKYNKSKEPDLSHKMYTRCMYRPSTSGGIYLAGLALRREAEFRLFQCGWYKWYNMMDEKFIEASSIGSGDAAGILASAERIHKYMEDNNYYYSLDTSRLASTFEASKQYKVTCCATYVSWVLRDAGLIDTCVHHCGTETGIGPVLRATGKFKELNITSLDQLQPGDVMWYPNEHTEIYAGNGTIYNAGSTEAIQRANPYASTRCPSKAFRCIVNTNNNNNNGSINSTSADLSRDGYDSIYTSRVTGKRFKQFKQNASSFSYPSISSVGCSWSSECGTVSTLIVGSGYNSNVSINTGRDLLLRTGGSTSISGYIRNLTGRPTVYSSTSVSAVRSYLNDGYVGVIHNPGYSGNGHFVAILDISSDGKQVYISNPDVYGSTGGNNGATKQGWNNISTVCNAIDSAIFVK